MNKIDLENFTKAQGALDAINCISYSLMIDFDKGDTILIERNNNKKVEFHGSTEIEQDVAPCMSYLIVSNECAIANNKLEEMLNSFAPNNVYQHAQSPTKSYFKLNNGDIYVALSLENARGRKCDCAFVDSNISIKDLHNIFMCLAGSRLKKEDQVKYF